jgi:hypothetical protein
LIPLPNLRACVLNDGKHGRWLAALDAANFREAEQLLADADTPSLLTLPAKATPWQ